MKYLKKILVLLLILLTVAGCNKDKEEALSVAGRTYYNKNLRDVQESFSEIWFGKDMSFVLKDYYFDGYYMVTGTYEVKENVIRISADNTDLDCYAKAIFEINDEHSITLKNDLVGSMMNDVFYDDKIQVDTSDSEKFILYNVNNESYVELFNDDSFAFSEIEGMGAVLIEGEWDIEGDIVAMFLNSDNIYDYQGNKISYFEFVVYDDHALVLNTDLTSSRKGDIFAFYEYIDDYRSEAPMGDNLDDYGSTWVHEAIADVSPDYYPSLELNTAGEFIFTENLYAGMGQIKGWYSKTDAGYECHVVDASMIQGFAGADVKIIVFEKTGDNQIVLKTDICMSRNGDKFNKQ